MGCASGKAQPIKIQNKKELSYQHDDKPKNSPQSRSQSTVDDNDVQDNSINRISILEQSCVGMKIFLQNECNQIMNQIKSQASDIKINSKLEDKVEILKLLINLADEIQERSYQLFDKDLKDEPKVEEYLISLIWACKKFRFKYTEDFLNKVEPLFQAQELNLKKVNVHLKKLISNLK